MRKQTRQWALCAALTGFLLGIHDGHIALWRDEDPQPLVVFDQRADSLPPYDRLLLHRGIHAGDLSALYALLEDYC